MRQQQYNAEEYVCNNCGDIYNLEELEAHTEILDIIDGRPYKEEYYICPGCGSDDITRYEENDGKF